MTRSRCLCCRFPLRQHGEGPVAGTKRASGRGLCDCCYSSEQTSGRLHLYPRRTRPAADVLDDALVYARRGMTRRDIALKLGYRNVGSLYQVFRRAGAWDAYRRLKLLTDGVAA